MKIIALVCALFIFSFASDVSATASLDVKSCAYSEQNKTLAVYDTKNSLNILNKKDLKTINKFDFKTDEITSLAFDHANLYAGFAGGEIAKFNDDFSSFAGMLNLSNLSLDTQITHLWVANGKIYAVVGKDAFISYDLASKKLARASLDGAYHIATCQILNGAALITSWDRSVFTVNLSTMKAKNLGRLKSVALSTAEINSGVIFGLASGEIASLKFDAEANLTSKQTGATNLTAEANLGDKENAILMNSTNLETKNSASTETKAAPNPIVQIYKISNSRIKSLLVVQDKVYIGLGNGEILRSDAEFKQIEKIGKNSDAVIKIFNDEDSVIAVSINGEIQIYKKKS
ncbi:hypothetical protein [uncultured Campylobacter sp.]|uniref:hypothetical protein n=1 Tax=uncultured Campylobacter sp. TaxID=218934 RepID=UPI00262DC1DF|nr:hypothetical protein [uncultured Campylobacter sp.]